MSFFEDNGLSILLTEPIFLSAGSGLSWEFDTEINSWKHTISVEGGYKSATFEIGVDLATVEDWLESGIGRHITCYNSSGGIVWVGFVNEIKSSMGSLTITRGPLMDVVNRVSVVYTPYIDITVDPPQTGDATQTTLADDADSHDKYGIQEEVVSGGTLMDGATYCITPADPACVPDNEAEKMRDAYLEEGKHLVTSTSLTLGQANFPILTLECVGYYIWLDRYIYDHTFTGTTTVPAKIIDVLGDDPNSIFSTNYDNISDSADFLLLTPDGDDKLRTAKTVIEEMVSMGDANDNRTYFMVMDGQICHYNVIPTTVDYYHSLATRNGEITTPVGSPISPWDARPAKWIFFPDFLVGREFPSELRLDPRNLFIESVTYTAPDGLQLTGGKTNTLKQFMAKFGVGV